MKIEVCEHALAAWLTHVKGCQVVQTNWKPSPLQEISEEDTKDISGFVEEIKKFSAEKELDILKKSKLSQMIQQCEIDIVGVRLEEGIVGNLYLIDSAFHENGLNYNDTVARVLKKIVRAIFVAGVVFKDIPAEVIFVSPKCGREVENKLRENLGELDKIIHTYYPDSKITLLFNLDFAAEVYAPLIESIDRLGDDNDLFLRSVKLARLAADMLRAAERHAPPEENDKNAETENTAVTIPGNAANDANGAAEIAAGDSAAGKRYVKIGGKWYIYTDLDLTGKSEKTREKKQKPTYVGIYNPRKHNQDTIFGILHGLLNNGLMDEETLQNLCNPVWCKRVLAMHSLFPVLLPAVSLPASGYQSVRFYKRETLNIKGKEYLVCSQWYPDNIRALRRWYKGKLNG